MLFLFNDRIFDLQRPEEVINSDEFPMSYAQFLKTSRGMILHLVREEIFATPLLVHEIPERARQLSLLVAAKTGVNAMLAGPTAAGARRADEIAIQLAEVSLMTISNLFQLQDGGVLSPQIVEKSVWAEMRKG